MIYIKELSNILSKIMISLTLFEQLLSEDFRMEIQNDSATPSESNQLKNVNTVRG